MPVTQYPPSFPVSSQPFTVPAALSDFRGWLLSKSFDFRGPHHTLVIKPPSGADPDDERYIATDRSFHPRSSFGRVEENHLALSGKLVHIQERYSRPLSPEYDPERGYQVRDIGDVLEAVLSRLDDQRTQATVSCHHRTLFGVFVQLLTSITKDYPGADPLATLLAREFPTSFLPKGGCYVALEHIIIGGNPNGGFWPGDVLTVEEANQIEQNIRRFGGSLWGLVEGGSLLNIGVDVPVPPLLPRVRELQQTPPRRIALSVPESIAVLVVELRRATEERDSPLTLPRTFPFEWRLSLAAPDVFPVDRYRHPPYKGFGPVRVSFTAPYPDPWGSHRLVIGGSMYPLISGSTGRPTRTLELGPVIVLDLSQRGERRTRVVAECNYALANEYFGHLIREIQEQWPGTSVLQGEKTGSGVSIVETEATRGKLEVAVEKVRSKGRPKNSSDYFQSGAQFLDLVGLAVKDIRGRGEYPSQERVVQYFNHNPDVVGAIQSKIDVRDLRRFHTVHFQLGAWSDVLASLNA